MNEDNLHPGAYRAVSFFKSIRRAIERGNMTEDGMIAPKRPFNNRGNTSKRSGVHSRSMNELKKRLYGEIKQQYGKVG